MITKSVVCDKHAALPSHQKLIVCVFERCLSLWIDLNRHGPLKKTI